MQGNDKTMQKIDAIISELKMIMQNNNITQTRLVTMLDGWCSRNTVLNFLNKEDADPRLSTLLLILDACGVKLRLETERSKEALMSGDIESYRVECEQIRAKLEETQTDLEFFRSRYNELIEKNTSLTEAINRQQGVIEKQQGQIERYMLRMENAENAIYEAHGDIRRKDARIVELSKKLDLW